MKILGYKGEWNSTALAKLVECSTRHCQYIVLVIPENHIAKEVGLLEQLMPYLIVRRVVSAWPGTVKLSGEQREMLKFSANDASYGILIDQVLPEMFQMTPVIEDVSLLRDDGRPFLITITHEHDAFFKVEPTEVAELIAAVGAENVIDVGEDRIPEEKY
jgi:hypothetical protein